MDIYFHGSEEQVSNLGFRGAEICGKLFCGFGEKCHFSFKEQETKSPTPVPIEPPSIFV